MMRAALNQAVHHAGHRSAFGKRLVEHPLMANVLADLALEAEAALLLAFRLGTAFDRSRADPAEQELQRALTPIAKYWLCRRMTAVAVEAMECLGGNGYVEEGALGRLYREAPLNGIWEGSANVICLDVLRALAHSPDALAALEREVAEARDPRLDKRMAGARRLLGDPATAEAGSRAALESIAVAMQGALMKRHGDAAAAEAFCRSRVESLGGAFGSLALGTGELAALVERAILREQ
jgi:putative acyl-CoA dehydrogenase